MISLTRVIVKQDVQIHIHKYTSELGLGTIYLQFAITKKYF